MSGSIDVLNTGLGHLRVTFDPGVPAEVDKARRMISDMMARGYAIFVDVGGTLKPVRGFDAHRAVYLVDDPPEVPAGATAPSGKKGRRGPGRPKAIPVTDARATAVGRTSGG